MKHLYYLIPIIALVLFATACGDDSADNPAFGDKDVPAIYMSWQENLAYEVGDIIGFTPQISPSDGATYEWYFDGVLISTEKDLAYEVTEQGEYTLDFIVTRNGVTNSRTANVVVVKPFVAKSYNKKSVAFLSKNGSVSDIVWDDITHIILTSAVVQADGQPDFATLEGGTVDIPNLITLAHNYGVYVILEYSGATNYLNAVHTYGMNTFYDPAVSSALQPTLIGNMVNYAVDMGFDGINVYMDKTPDTATYPDEAGLKTFYENLANAVPADKLIGDVAVPFFLTLSVYTGWTNASLMNMVNIPRYDWVNVLAFAAEDLTPGPQSSMWMFSDQATQWMNWYGVASERLVMACPAFSLRYYGDPANYTWANLWLFTEYLAYKDLCARYPDAPQTSMLDVDNGIYYDGLQSIQEKADWVIANNLGGLSLWSIESDDKTPANSLMKKINTALGN